MYIIWQRFKQIITHVYTRFYYYNIFKDGYWLHSSEYCNACIFSSMDSNGAIEANIRHHKTH